MVDVARLQIEADSRQVKGASRDLDRLSTSADKAATSSRSLSTTTVSLSRVYRELAAIMGTLKFLDTIRQTIELNQRYKELGIAMNVVGRNVGINTQQLNQTTAALEKMGISMIEARQTVTRLAASHIDLANAEKLADLARNAAIVGQINTSEALERIVHGIRSAEVEVLKTIGITVQFDQAYKKLSEQLGKTTKDLTQQEKQQARINVVLEEAPALVGLYEAAMGNAGKQFRSTARLSENLQIKIGELFDEAVQLSVRTYTNLLNDLDDTFSEMSDTGELTAWSETIADTFAFLADATRVSLSPVLIAIQAINTALTAGSRIKSGDPFGAIEAFQSFDKFAEEQLSVIANSSKFRDELEAMRVQRDLLTDAVGKGAGAIKEEEVAIKSNTGSVKKLQDERSNFINSIKKQAAEAGKTRLEIQKMEAAVLGVSDAVAPYLELIEDQATAEEDLRISREKQAEDLQKIESITKSVRTRQEIYNDTVKELDDLLQKGLGFETYQRALKEAQDELEKTGNKTREVTDEVTQLWKQAGRNIQSTLADSIFNFFRDGLDGMVANVGRAIGRIASEFAALRLAQGMGLAGMFGMPGAASAGGGMGGSMGFANLAAGTGNIINSGFGLSSLFGSFATSGAGQGLGLSVTGPVANFGQLTPLGSGLSTGIGAFGAGAAGVGIGSLLAGNNEIGGLGGTATSTIGAGVGAAAGSIVPGVGTAIGALAGGVIGGAINALFGRGPLEFQEQTLTGDVTAGGFDGALVDRFKAKGGLFRGSKTDNIIASTQTGDLLNQFGEFSESGISGGLQPIAEERAQQAVEIGKLLNETFSSLSDSMRGTADVLDISTDGLDAFRAELHLVSESGEALASQAISEEISRISDEMARALIPNIEELSRHGETSSQTVSRLNAEFLSLQNALELLGVSSEQTRLFLTGLSAEQRTAFTDAAGGADALTQKITFFAENFLSAEEKLEISMNRLNVEMAKLGLSADISVEQFRELVQSVTQAGGVSVEFANSLLDLAPAFITVKNQMEALEQTTIDVDSTNDLAEAQQRVFDARAQLISSYQDERSELESVKAQFVGIADTLRDASDKLSLSGLSPLTPGQRLEEARRQFNVDRRLAESGDTSALERLPQSATEFLKASQIFNASSAEFTSDFNLVKQVLDSAAAFADQEASIADKQLSQLEQSVNELVDINSGVKSVEDAIRELIAATLQGPGNPDISGQAIRDFINSPGVTAQDAINKATKEGVSGSQISDALGVENAVINQATGGQSVSDREIQEFVNANIDDPMAIYNAAIANGISSTRLSDATGIPISEINQFVRDNNLAAFEKGTDFVPRTGIAMLHKGEAVVGSTVADEIKALRQELAALRREQNQQTNALINTTIESQRMNADLISKSNDEIARSTAWREQRVGVR